MNGKQPTVRFVWEDEFDQRELAQIKFSRVYVDVFAHGAPGHLPMNVTAKLTHLLEQATGTRCPPVPDSLT